MTCAKQVVTCTLKLRDGTEVVGRNDCRNPQRTCPRQPGEGYEKCKTVCGQDGHAEVQAVVNAARQGSSLEGALAELRGHTYACADCQHALQKAGVRGVLWMANH